MKAEELRYGNNVTLGDGVVRTVIETREKSVYLQGFGYAVWVDNVKPIELNNEILDRNFEVEQWVDFKHWVLSNTWQMWRNPNYGYILGTLDIEGFGHYIPCIPCTYFHELQNLLIDLRINKKIEI